MNWQTAILQTMLSRFWELYEKERQPFTANITKELDDLQGAIKELKNNLNR